MSASGCLRPTRSHADAGERGALLRRRGIVAPVAWLSALLLVALVAACGQGSREEEETHSEPDTALGSASDTASSGSTTASGAQGSVSNAPGSGGASTSASSSSAGPGPGAADGPDYRIDAMVGWHHFESLKCGSPAGDWDIHVSGVQSLGGGSLVLTGEGRVTLDATSLQGPWNAQYAIRLEGVPAAIGGQDGTVTGNATLAGAVLQIRGQTGRGTFFSQTPAMALAGAADNPTRDLDLPVLSGPFC